MYNVMLGPEVHDARASSGTATLGSTGGATHGHVSSHTMSNTTRPPPMSMAAPPAMEFTSRDELLDFQKTWAEQQGFAVVIGRSRPNRLWIKCDRGGEYSDKHLNDPENRKRKRKATRLTGCPFNVKATMKKDKIWRCHTECGEHNHPPSEDLTIHPSLRRMTDEQLHKVNEMTEAGNTPVETLEELQRLWPNIKVLRRDIYNARKKYKTEKELAQMSNGNQSTPQPRTWEDPNGKIPGPTPTGRWEWLEDGDEVKRKKRKKSSVSASGAGGSSGARGSGSLHTPTPNNPPMSASNPGGSSMTPHSTIHSQHQHPHHPHALDPSLRDNSTRSPQLPSPGNHPRRGITPGMQPRGYGHPPHGPYGHHQHHGHGNQGSPGHPAPLQPDFPGALNGPGGTNSPGRFRAYNPPGLGSGGGQGGMPGSAGLSSNPGGPPSNAASSSRGYVGRTTSQENMAPPMRQQSSRGAEALAPMASMQSPLNGSANLQGGAGGSGAYGGTGSGGGASGGAGGGPTAVLLQGAQGGGQYPQQQGGGSGGGGGGGSTTGGSASGGKQSASGQVLMSRIERMEKEQRDQKAILSQILGAVQGMGGGGMGGGMGGMSGGGGRR
jgi:hypothetical protein